MVDKDNTVNEILKTQLLDHFKNTMPIPVDRDYAEYLLEQLIAKEINKSGQKLLKKAWNLSQPDTVPSGWKPDTKLGRYLKENIK